MADDFVMSHALREKETRTLVCYESSHRISDCIADMVVELGSQREATLARELTKVYEETRRGSLAELSDYFSQGTIKGEIVLVVEGARDQ